LQLLELQILEAVVAVDLLVLEESRQHLVQVVQELLSLDT
jgi:hypothetical protein